MQLDPKALDKWKKQFLKPSNVQTAIDTKGTVPPMSGGQILKDILKQATHDDSKEIAIYTEEGIPISIDPDEATPDEVRADRWASLVEKSKIRGNANV